jgi:hypothetical protein
VETGLDEAVRVPVVGGVELLPARWRQTFSARIAPAKCVTEPAFDVGTSVASPMAKTSGRASD